jgi:transcription antitermination factor NusG
MEAKWHVLHVRPRCEKKIATYCSQNGIATDLPLRQETKIYQRRKVTVEKPLFPGYVFVFFTPDERGVVLKSNQIVRIIEVLDQNQLVRELDQIRRVLAIDPTLGASEAFSKGRRVRIVSGPFQGLEGIVETVRGQTRVHLNVEILGQAVVLEVDTELLEAGE